MTHRSALVVLLLTAWCAAAVTAPVGATRSGGSVLTATEQPPDAPTLRSPAAGEQVARLCRPSATGTALAGEPSGCAVVAPAPGPLAVPLLPPLRRRRVPSRRVSRAPDEPS